MTDTPPPVQASAQRCCAKQVSEHAARHSNATEPCRAAAAALGRRIVELCDELAQFSEEPDRLTCTYLTPRTGRSRRNCNRGCRQRGSTRASMRSAMSSAATASADPDAKTLIVGSHYDTVRDAGKYDGRLGIVTALVVAEELSRRQYQLPFHLEVIAFAEEEGVRFGTAYLGSRVVAGRFEPQILERRDASGATVAGRDPFGRRQSGRHPGAGAPARRPAGLSRGPYRAGPGAARGRSSARNRHRDCRRRALRGGDHGRRRTCRNRADGLAARCGGRGRRNHTILETLCRETPGLVGTVGQINVPNGAINVIPGRCDLSLDIRSEDEDKLARAIADVQARIAADRTVPRRHHRDHRAAAHAGRSVLCRRCNVVFADALQRASVPVRAPAERSRARRRDVSWACSRRHAVCPMRQRWRQPQPAGNRDRSGCRPCCQRSARRIDECS